MRRIPLSILLALMMSCSSQSNPPSTSNSSGHAGGAGGGKSGGAGGGGGKGSSSESGGAAGRAGGAAGTEASTGGVSGAGGNKPASVDGGSIDSGRAVHDASGPVFKAIMWSVKDPWHFFMDDAKTYIQELGKQYNFVADFSEDLTKQTDAFLAQYQVYINLNIEVTPLNAEQKKAFEGFINAGKGWVGFHMAGNNKQDWPWYDAFLGGCKFTGHPAIQQATINIEDRKHPASINLPSATWKLSDEFYEWDKSPRPNVRVLASLDEKSYKPAKAIGDHPYVWCNEKYPRTIFIGVGHVPTLWTGDQTFRTLVRDSILWAGGVTDKTPTLVAPGS